MFCKNCGKPVPDGDRFCEFCGYAAPALVSSQARNNSSAAPADAASPVRERPELAVRTALLFSAAWLLCALLQELFMDRLVYSRGAFSCMAVALLGVCVYLLSLGELKWKLWGGGLGLLSALLLTLTEFLNGQASMMTGGIRLFSFFANATFGITLGSILLSVLLCLGAGLLVYGLSKKSGEGKLKRTAVISALVYFLARSVIRCRGLLRALLHGVSAGRDLLIVLKMYLPFDLISSLVIFFVCLGVYRLCRSENKDVKLFGLGRVWAWLALAGSLYIFGMLCYCAAQPSLTAYRIGASGYQLALGAAAFIGYLQLIRGKRRGLYYILIGVGALCLSQLCNLFFAAGASGFFKNLYTALSGLLNPLFGYLAVRAADKAAGIPRASEASSAPAAPVAAPAPTVKQAAPAPAVNKAASAPVSAPVKATSGEKLYYESDNMGTRQESMAQATAYWLGERTGLKEKPPFTMFTMPSREAAEQALLELPFIHRAADSGKLICDRLMTFGCYQVTEYGKPTGEYELLVTGSDFTLDEYRLAESACNKYGGTLKNHDEPKASVKASSSSGNAGLVKYSETVKGNDGISVYEVYTGPDRASAMAFLSGKPVTRRLYYIVVDTPEGSFGRDINGYYQE